MSRWEVYRARFLTGGWGEWAACSDDEPTRYFLTWREAMDYADRQARTREIVLPRVFHSGGWVPNMPTLKIGWEHHPAETTFWVEDGSWDAITLRLDELRPLAAVLFALAGQEETK